MDEIKQDDLMFILMCVIKEYGTDNVLALSKVGEINEWLEGLEDKDFELGFLPDYSGEGMMISLLQGKEAIDEFRRLLSRKVGHA